MKFCLRLFALILFCHVLAFSQAGRHVRVPGTRLWIEPAPDFQFVGSFPMMQSKGNARITFSESALPFTQAMAFLRDSSKAQDFRVLKVTTIDDTSNYRKKTVTLHKMISLIDPQGITVDGYVCGDTKESFMVTIEYPDSTSDRYKDILAKIIAGLQWRNDIEMDPLEEHDFTLKGLKEYFPVSRARREILYTPYGLMMDSSMSIPCFNIRSLLSRWTDPSAKEKKTFFEETFQDAEPWIHMREVIEHSSILLDGVEGYEAVGRGFNEVTDTTAIVYVAVLFHPSGFLGFIGISPEKDHDLAVGRFKEITRSFERVRFDRQDDSTCRRLLESKEFAKAEKCYSALLKKDSASVSAILGRAQALMGLKKYEAAISLYNGLIEEHENLDSAYIGRAQAYMRSERYRDAINDYDRAIDLNSDKLQYFVERAEAKDKYGNGQGAAADYEKAIRMSPGSMQYYVAYAKAMLGTNEEVKAEAMLEQALEIDSANGAICQLLGDALHQQKKYSQALLFYNRAEEHGERTSDLYLRRSKVKVFLDNITGAFSDACAACRIDKRSKEALYFRGKYNFYLGRLKDAVNDFTASIGYHSEREDQWMLRGISYLVLNKNAEAAADFRKCRWFFDSRILLYLAERNAYNEAAAHKNLILYKNSLEAGHNDGLGVLAAQYALREITADEFVERVMHNIDAKKHTYYDHYDLGKTFFIIGMMEYFSGLKVGSKNTFERCIKNIQPESEDYQIARTMMNDTWQ